MQQVSVFARWNENLHFRLSCSDVWLIDTEMSRETTEMPREAIKVTAEWASSYIKRSAGSVMWNVALAEIFARFFFLQKRYQNV